MEQTRTQLLGLGQRFDALAQAHTALQQGHDNLSFHTGTALAQRQQQIQEIEDKLKNMQFKQQFGLLDLKNMRPEMFKGNRGEIWRPWARKFKKEQNEIPSHLPSCPWDKGQAADSKLHDFLLATLGGKAVMLVETPGLEGRV